MMNTLKDALTGKDYEVVKLHGTGAIKRRIMDMGLTKGTPVHIRKVQARHPCRPGSFCRRSAARWPLKGSSCPDRCCRR